VSGVSERALRRLIADREPTRKVSRDALLELKKHLGLRAEQLISAALMIHDRENNLRQVLGERPKVKLASRHVRMAIEGKFQGKGGDEG